jgi:hypothetical protein
MIPQSNYLRANQDKYKARSPQGKLISNLSTNHATSKGGAMSHRARDHSHSCKTFEKISIITDPLFSVSDARELDSWAIKDPDGDDRLLIRVKEKFGKDGKIEHNYATCTGAWA